ncbi:hypothetical protein [Ferrovibrio xuzhouensis]|uniref:Uncharacterized protein n=1 Tax=Ferrovibrio xuzhouensis TaxID=1576914 RepID=A0ABV7VFH8_9PROT
MTAHSTLSGAAMRQDGMQPDSMRSDSERQDYDTRQRVISTRDARAGIELHRMRYVLAFGLAGAIAACLVVWLALVVS